MKMSSAKSLMAAGLIGLAGVASLSSAAFAGADDGGSKAFFDLNAPGSAYAAPSETTPAQAVQPPVIDEGYRAAAGQDFEGYRTPPLHHRRYWIPVR